MGLSTFGSVMSGFKGTLSFGFRDEEVCHAYLCARDWTLHLHVRGIEMSF